MSSGGGDFQGAPDHGLPFDVGEIGTLRCGSFLFPSGFGIVERTPAAAIEQFDRIGEILYRINCEPLSGGDGGFPGVGGRNKQSPDSVFSGESVGAGENSADGPHSAVEAEFSEYGADRQVFGIDHAGGGEDAEGDSKVKSGALLAQVGGGEVDHGDSPRGCQAGADDCRTDPVAALFDRHIGQPDDGDGTVSGGGRGDVDLDFNRMGVNSDHCG